MREKIEWIKGERQVFGGGTTIFKGVVRMIS